MNGLEIGANVVEAVLETQFFVRYFGVKHKRYGAMEIILFAVVHFVAMSICNWITYLSAVELIVMLLIRFGLAMLLLQGRVGEKILITLVDSIILQSSSILLSSLFGSFVSYDESGYMQFGVWRVVLLILAKVIYVIATELILHHQIKDKEYISRLMYVELNIVVCGLLLSFAFLSEFIYRNSVNHRIVNSAVFLLIFVIIVDAMVYALFINLTNTSISLLKEQKRASAYERRVSDVQAMKELNRQTAKINHDIKSKLLNIRALLEQGRIDEAKHYLDENIEAGAFNRKIIFTDSMAIDAVLNSHQQKCEEMGINSTMKLECAIDPKMELDIAVLLTNLLDNAVEAAVKTPEKEVELLINRKGNTLCILVQNSYDGNLRKEKEHMVTSKQDESRHGYGVSNVKDIVDKYDGIYDYDADNKVFTTKINFFVGTE